MKREYLGDCSDFYKRWFLAESFPGTQLGAIPMLTDEWDDNDADLYSRLLGVEVIQRETLPNRCPQDPVRVEYFQVALNDLSRDIFLDPDTGLRIGDPPRRRRFDEYLFASELSEILCPRESRRVAIIYDQSIARGNEVGYMQQKVSDLYELGLFALAYCAQVAMVAVSRCDERIHQLHQAVTQLAYLPGDRVVSNIPS